MIKNNNYIARLIPRIKDNGWLFREVFDQKEINNIINERNASYSKCGIEGGGATMFDNNSFGRFFELLHKKTDYCDCNRVGAVRIVNRANKAGILPLDLSLMNCESRKTFSDLLPIPEELSSPDINPSLKKDLFDVVGGSPSEKTYEIGGFYSNLKRNLRIPILLSFGVVRQSIKEGWSKAIQVQNPKHIKFYKTTCEAFGMPYKETGNFVDYCGRPASVLSWSPKFASDVFEKTVERIFAPNIYSVVEKTTAKDTHSATRKHAY